jgi:outer membrane receptor for ferric coprogen and ferric-rhodotorulic acid
MKILQTYRKSMLALSSALAFAALTLPGQEAAKNNPAPSSIDPKSSDTSPSVDEEPVILDPFSVTSDKEGYKATDTLGGSRVRTKLADTPSSISVITPKFMQDLGINNAQDLLVYTNNTEVAGLGGNFSGVATRGAGITIA